MTQILEKPTFNQQALVDTEGAAYLLSIPAATLTKWRCTGYGNIPYVKLGRKVRYKPSDLKNYVDRHVQN